MKENDKYSVWKLYSIIKSPGDVQYDIYISGSQRVLKFCILEHFLELNTT